MERPGGCADSVALVADLPRPLARPLELLQRLCERGTKPYEQETYLADPTLDDMPAVSVNPCYHPQPSTELLSIQNDNQKTTVSI